MNTFSQSLTIKRKNRSIDMETDEVVNTEEEDKTAQGHRANFWVGRKETQGRRVWRFSVQLLPEKSNQAETRRGRPRR